MNSITFLLFISRVFAWQTLRLAESEFQHHNSVGALDITSLDTRTASYNNLFYTIDTAASAFVELGTVSRYIAADQLDEVMCFRVNSDGFHSLELSDGGFSTKLRRPNGSLISSTPLPSVVTVLSEVCALYNGELCYAVDHRVAFCGQSPLLFPDHLLDMTDVNGSLVLLTLDTELQTFSRHITGSEPLVQQELVDTLFGGQPLSGNTLGDLGDAGPYPIFELLHESASVTTPVNSTTMPLLSEATPQSSVDRDSSLLSDSTSSVADTSTSDSSRSGGVDIRMLTLEIFTVADYITSSVTSVTLLDSSSTYFNIATGPLTLDTLNVGSGSTLYIDVSGQDVEDGTTLTLFIFSEMTGNYDEIVVDGWTDTCHDVEAERSGNDPNSIQITLRVTENSVCNNAGAIQNLAPLLAMMSSV